MKPWQTKETAGQAVAKPPKRHASSDDRLRTWNAIMKASRAFFAEAGKRSARACQFKISDDASWYVVVDEAGGRAERGLHAAPVAIWESDREALEAAFAGKLLPGRIRIAGDYETLKQILRAIAQAPIR
jgi:hypothetical protein